MDWPDTVRQRAWISCFNRKTWQRLKQRWINWSPPP